MSKTADMARYRQEIAKGDVLLREGDVDTRFFLLQKGSLDIFIRGNKINTIEAIAGQDFVGEIGAILGTPRTATVVAATDCVVLCLPRIEIEAVISASPTLGVKLIQSLCYKLADSASAFAEFQVKDVAIPGSGNAELSLRNYAKGILYLIERSADDPSHDTVERLHKYFLDTNPWCIRHGDGDFILESQVP
jgi:CRP/FNR family cyclic AMP-dependent transcriptional regulator